MSAPATPFTIVGQGLAGTCLAWCLWQQGADFRILDRGTGGSSRVAAGLINPITGKNFEPSWRIADFLPDAIAFYQSLENQFQSVFWHPLPVLRLAGTDKEWRKISAKLSTPEVIPWIAGEVPPPPGWAGAVELHGGGRVDVPAFLAASRAFFRARGLFQEIEVTQAPGAIFCEGSAGLISGRYGPHRCAKGEILSVRADWDISGIRIGAGGWLVPLGRGIFKVGSTYEWSQLDELPTDAGRTRVCEIIHRLGGDSFQIIAHEAGIRPILRRSQPLIGPLPGGGWMFNALGSKGALYAPGVARRLADWLLDGKEPESDLDFRTFSTTS